MTIRQRFLKLVYPLLMLLIKQKFKKGLVRVNEKNIRPPISFYHLTAVLNDGSVLDFNNLKGKKVLIVNTASDCMYTGQYSELEKLYKRYKHTLIILAFPSNDFKQQEKGDDDTIAEFCKQNFAITFCLMQKTAVTKGGQQSPVFNWLADADKNGWNTQLPVWNFSKYLINENGDLTHFFKPAATPLSKEVISAIEN